MLKIIKLGISPFIILATDSIIIIAMNAALQKFGDGDADLLISAVTVIQSYFLLITGPLIGISGGVQPLISFNFGAKSSERVKKAIVYASIMGIVFTSAAFVLSRVCAGTFVSFFVDGDAIYDISVWGIGVFTLAIVPLSVQYVLVDALTALGKIKVSLYLSASRKITFLVSIVLLAAFSSAAQNAFYAEPIADILSALQTAILFVIVYKSLMKQYMRTYKL